MIRRARAACIVVVALGACASNDADRAPDPPVATTTMTAEPATARMQPHDCIDREHPPEPVPWSELRNPIYAPDRMVKDQALRAVNGRWYLFFSERFDGDEGERTPAVSSTDLQTWTPVDAARGETWDSPDLTQNAVDGFVMTHQAPGANGTAKVVYRTAPEIDGPWSAPTDLLGDPFPGVRTIDGALAHTDSGLIAIAKSGETTQIPQTQEVFYAASGALDGPWQPIGQADMGWSENFQFLPIDGTWHVLVTTIPIHEPTLFRLSEDPGRAENWLHWTKVATLVVPAETWNSPRAAGAQAPTAGFTHERANSAYLCDARDLDGYWYLTYAGSDELDTHEGRGLARIGIARSKDLQTWTVPPN